MAGKKKGRTSQPRAGSAIGEILKGLADLMQRLGELAESGSALSKTRKTRGTGKELKGVYGFTIQVGLGGEGASLEPFGNIRRDIKSGRTELQEVREPLVDVFEEGDHLLVQAELPGISPADVRIDAKNDVLTISAARGDRKYRKEVLLPGDLSRKKMQICCKNGILEVKCPKWRAGEEPATKPQRSRSRAKSAEADRRE